MENKNAAYVEAALNAAKHRPGLRHGVTPCAGRVELRLRYHASNGEWKEVGRVSLSTELTLEQFDRAAARAWLFLSLEHKRLALPPVEMVDGCGNPWP